MQLSHFPTSGGAECGHPPPCAPSPRRTCLNSKMILAVGSGPQGGQGGSEKFGRAARLIPAVSTAGLQAFQATPLRLERDLSTCPPASPPPHFWPQDSGRNDEALQGSGRASGGPRPPTAPCPEVPGVGPCWGWPADLSSCLSPGLRCSQPSEACLNGGKCEGLPNGTEACV